MFFKVFLVAVLFSLRANAFESLAPVVEKVMPSVVSIDIESADPNDSEQIKDSLTFLLDRGFIGSGFVADESGYILTNRHVVEKAKKITVKTSDGNTYEAELVGQDDVMDVALLKINAFERLSAAVFADSDLIKTGDFILAVGNPFGLENTVTTGIVSAKGRDMKETPFDDYIQTDAPMNPGNSGGPMFNLEGEVVGLNTLIYSKQGNSLGVGFAISSNQLKPIYKSLKEKGKVVRSTIGVELKETTYDNMPALIVSTLKDEALSKTNNLKAGDLILAFDGEPITTKKAFETKISWAEPDSVLTLEILRDGERFEQEVMTKAALKEDINKHQVSKLVAKDGVYYASIGLKLDNLRVVDVDAKSEADMKGVKAGDEIRGINGHSVLLANDLQFYINESIDEKKPLHINLSDADGALYFVDITPKRISDGTN